MMEMRRWLGDDRELSWRRGETLRRAERMGVRDNSLIDVLGVSLGSGGAL
jgi:hypothetical protein